MHSINKQVCTSIRFNQLAQASCASIPSCHLPARGRCAARRYGAMIAFGGFMDRFMLLSHKAAVATFRHLQNTENYKSFPSHLLNGHVNIG